jgi:hypothetical protein
VTTPEERARSIVQGEYPLDMGWMAISPEVQDEIVGQAIELGVLPSAVKRPKRGRSRDGIYPRCVWCDGENYALAVMAYSRGEIPCASTTACGRFLPDDYLKLNTQPKDDNA